MRINTIDFLRCPFCANCIELKPGGVEDELGVFFGVTACAGCGYEFPIVGGVLIVAEPGQLIGVEAEAPAFLGGRGVAARTLCRLVREGKHVEAFSRLLNPAAPNADLLVRADSPGNAGGTAGVPDMVRPEPHRQPRIPTHVQDRLNRFTGGRLLHRARRRIGEFLLENQNELTALEAMNLYMARYSRAETAVHFAFSFGQPRHLAALAIASVLKDRGGPILDLACGPGHLTHFFCTGVDRDRPVVGVDRNFFRLYVARNYVAPRADFICQWVDRPLPFSSGSFDSAFCSDAFHLILNKVGCVREARRVIAPDGLIGIVRFGNAAQEPREGHELTIDGYARLFDKISHLLLGEHELVESYRQRKGPDLRRRETPVELRGQKWLSAFLFSGESEFRVHGSFADWPHSAGCLVVNPIYRVESGTPNEGLTLRFEFPSEWYAFENEDYAEYAPDRVEISPEVLVAVRAGERSAAVKELIDRFVIIGVPDRYMPDRFPLV